MAWVAVNKDGREIIYEEKPNRAYDCVWLAVHVEEIGRGTDFVVLPRGSIKKLIGRELSFTDEPVELKEE